MTFGDALGLRGCDDAHAFHSGWLSWPNMHGLTPHGADGVINMTVSLLSMSHGEVAKGMCLGSGLFGRSMGREVPSLRWVSDSKLLSLDSDMVPERDARPSTQDARQSTQDARILGRAPSMPGRAPSMLGRAPSMPGRAPSMLGRALRMPDRALRMPAS